MRRARKTAAMGASLILALATVVIGTGPATADDEPEVTTPANFQVDIGASTVTVEWDPSTSAAGEIAIYHVKLDQRWGWTVEPTMTYHLERNRTYSITVQAQDAEYNRSDWSDPIEFTTSDEFPVTTPANVQVSDSPGTVTVEWDPSASDAGVMDYVATLHGARIGPIAHRTTDTTATFTYPPGGDLEVTVRARDNAYRWSDTSDPVEVTVAPTPDWEPPSAPTNFRAAGSDVGVLFEWDEPPEGPGPFRYQIHLDGSATEFIYGDTHLDSPYFQECTPGRTSAEFTITATSYGFTSPHSEPITLCF